MQHDSSLRPTFIPHVRVKPSAACFYYEYSGPPKRSNDPPNFAPLPESNEHNGTVSDKAKKRISTAIGWLCLLSRSQTFNTYKTGRLVRFRLAFVTLTLPSEQLHSDKELKQQLLNQFFIEAYTKWKVELYIWRAELQKCGHLHFHVIVNKFIPYQELRNVWNRLLAKLGYVDQYRANQKAFHANGFRMRPVATYGKTRKQQYKAYKFGMRTNWSSPNTTDVHRVHHLKKLPGYLYKEMTKQTQTPAKHELSKQPRVDGVPNWSSPNRIVGGRLWGLSHKLSSFQSMDFVYCGDIEREIEDIAVATDAIRYPYDYCTCLYFDDFNWLDFPAPTIQSAFVEYVTSRGCQLPAAA